MAGYEHLDSALKIEWVQYKALIRPKSAMHLVSHRNGKVDYFTEQQQRPHGEKILFFNRPIYGL